MPTQGTDSKTKKEEEQKMEESTDTTTPNPTPAENEEEPRKTYLKAMPLHTLDDIETIKNEVNNGNIIILKITPLANKNLEDVKTAVNELYEFTEAIHGDIARLGEERIVICPEKIRIWREKKPAQNNPVPTAA